MLKQILQKLIKVIYLTALFTLIGYSGIAQPGINGAGCIIPGTTYEYMITGQWDSSSSARLCITGGILNSGDSCISLQTSPAMVLVIWNDSVADRKIEVTSDLGNASLIVTGTIELTGGVVDDSDEVQIFDADQLTYTFHCATPTGGSCDPHYTYQWQRSTTQLNWTNVQGATGKDLEYSGTITACTFFRRVTKETQSNIVAYSDSGQLMIVYD
jgi:hypothetical protein